LPIVDQTSFDLRASFDPTEDASGAGRSPTFSKTTAILLTMRQGSKVEAYAHDALSPKKRCVKVDKGDLDEEAERRLHRRAGPFLCAFR
jgi:hypothetical protein